MLPFREIDLADTRPYFGDGIAEYVIIALASLSDLFVVSCTSTARFRDSSTDVRSVGRELGVRYVLSGSVRRMGERLRITAELADSETQTVLWTERIDGHGDDLFDLQDRVSERTITTIAPHVRDAEVRRAFRKRPENLDAYDFTLRGLDLLYHLHRDEFERAREMFDRAITLDPGYATPYALSALWHSIRFEQGWSVDPATELSAVTRCAEMALERDPFDARALALCGHLRAFRLRDYEGAVALFDRALASSPNSSVAWIRSSPTYSYLGDGAEATRRGRRASSCRRWIPTASIRMASSGSLPTPAATSTKPPSGAARRSPRIQRSRRICGFSPRPSARRGSRTKRGWWRRAFSRPIPASASCRSVSATRFAIASGVPRWRTTCARQVCPTDAPNACMIPP